MQHDRIEQESLRQITRLKLSITLNQQLERRGIALKVNVLEQNLKQIHSLYQSRLTLLHKKAKTAYNPTALRKAKIAYNFGLSECNRVNIIKIPAFIVDFHHYVNLIKRQHNVFLHLLSQTTITMPCST